MTVDTLLGQLAALDVVLSVEGERLLFDAPAGALTPELRAAVAAHRGELVCRLALLRPEPAEPGPIVTYATEGLPEAETEADMGTAWEAGAWGSAGRPIRMCRTIGPAPLKPGECRCGSVEWKDIPIHNGQSVRRDYAGCRRFLDFPVWYGSKHERKKG